MVGASELLKVKLLLFLFSLYLCSSDILIISCYIQCTITLLLLITTRDSTTMISFGVTPLTDLPAHRIIRSYFTKVDEKQTAADSELSHLWSKERLYEEERFASIMTDLNAVAKELGVTVSPDSRSSAAAASNLTQCANNAILSSTPENEDKCRHLATPLEACAYKDLDAWQSLKKAQEDRWLNSMNIKVQTLLQEAHDVLGTSAVPFNTSESPFEIDNGACGDEASYSVPFDVISLYMRDDECSFASEASTLLEGNASFDHDPVFVGSSSGGDWLVGDTSTDTTDTSFSLDQCPTTDKLNRLEECLYEPRSKCSPVFESLDVQYHSNQQSVYPQ